MQEGRALHSVPRVACLLKRMSRLCKLHAIVSIMPQHVLASLYNIHSPAQDPIPGAVIDLSPAEVVIRLESKKKHFVTARPQILFEIMLAMNGERSFSSYHILNLGIITGHVYRGEKKASLQRPACE
jgi:hypothetical protein